MSEAQPQEEAMSSTTSDQVQHARETSLRVFASELNESTFDFKPSDSERAPRYVLLPTCARVNRIFLVGALIDVEEHTNKNGDPFLTGNIHDGTETFSIMASSYDPDALNQLGGIEPPEIVACVGKPRVNANGDETYVNVDIESIIEVNVAERKKWVIDTAKKTKGRIIQADQLNQLDEVRGTTQTEEDYLFARKKYPSKSPSDYFQPIHEAIETIILSDGE